MRSKVSVCVCVCVCVSGCCCWPAALQGAAVFLVGRRAITNPGRLLIGRQPVLRHRLTLPANTHSTQRVRHTHTHRHTSQKTHNLQGRIRVTKKNTHIFHNSDFKLKMCFNSDFWPDEVTHSFCVCVCVCVCVCYTLTLTSAERQRRPARPQRPEVVSSSLLPLALFSLPVTPSGHTNTLSVMWRNTLVLQQHSPEIIQENFRREFTRFLNSQVGSGRYNNADGVQQKSVI